jgi:hypothetical protein
MNVQTKKPARPLNLCTTCGKDFGGIRAFDMHRVGAYDHEYDEQHPDGRRCLTDAEMIALGMYINAFGRWSQPRNGLSERLGLRSQPSDDPVVTV